MPAQVASVGAASTEPAPGGLQVDVKPEHGRLLGLADSQLADVGVVFGGFEVAPRELDE
jgi:hypothetical protein